ncbi:MAG: hypothetical protein AAFP76_10360 [Bacteroidota bacterium]
MKRLLLLFTMIIVYSCGAYLEPANLLNKEDHLVRLNLPVAKNAASNFRQDNSGEINQMEFYVESHTSFQFMTDSISDISLDGASKIRLIDEVTKLFDPDNSSCELPKKVERRLAGLKKKNQNWAPEEVTRYVDNLPEYGYSLSGKSINILMHTVEIKPADGSDKWNWPLLESPTYENFDLNNYIAKSGFNSFMYSLDCSGYLNAAIEASATIPGADIKSKAQSALTNQNSLFIGGGVLISPIASAYYNNAFGVSLTDDQRKKILDAIIKIPNVKDDDQIIVSSSFDAIWYSDNGTSSFNGKANIGGAGGFGIGVLNITTTSNAGGNFSRQSSFTSFNTFFTNRKLIPNLKPFSIKDVKRERAKIK